MTSISITRVTVLLLVLSLNVVEGVNAQECMEPDCIPTPACESDEDCSDGMTCVEVTSCVAEDDSGCREDESDEDCIARTSELSCRMVSKHICLPTWTQDCTDDSDCPEEFACRATAGTPPCEPLDKTCETDADCPGGWLCETYDTGFCTGGDGCVGNQTHETACVPPALEGSLQADASGPAEDAAREDTASGTSNGDGDDTAASASSGCSVARPLIGALSDRGLPFALLAVAWVARRRRRA